MAYTLTQARGLLTAAELSLFDQSRAAPIKDLTAARLRGKVTRARALRDKYRDLYRRQTVATRGTPASKRSAVGGDNQRTGRKAEVFAEVLERFEARLTLLEGRAEREAGKLAPARKAVRSKAVAAPKKIPAKKVAAKKAVGTKAKPVRLKTAVKKALKIKQAAVTNGASDTRSAKAPAAQSPLGAAAAGAPPMTAPLDIPARAARRNPLKESAAGIALHAHAGSQTRRAQGKRDSR
jgi:hypothetical protein